MSEARKRIEAARLTGMNEAQAEIAAQYIEELEDQLERTRQERDALVSEFIQVEGLQFYFTEHWRRMRARFTDNEHQLVPCVGETLMGDCDACGIPHGLLVPMLTPKFPLVWIDRESEIKDVCADVLAAMDAAAQSEARDGGEGGVE